MRRVVLSEPNLEDLMSLLRQILRESDSFLLFDGLIVDNIDIVGLALVVSYMSSDGNALVLHNQLRRGHIYNFRAVEDLESKQRIHFSATALYSI